MADFSSFLSGVNIHVPVIKPTYSKMNVAYNDYKTDSNPCKGNVINQCAVRMSVALGRCGRPLNGFPDRSRIHRGKYCQLTMPHVPGAEELANYLKTIWGVTMEFKGGTLDDAKESLSGKKGVVYFNNCFRRESGGPKTGDHIDLWTGVQYYNDIIKVKAGGTARVGADLFSRANKIWFFELPA